MEKLNRITLLDDSKRPKAPKIETITPSQRRHGRRLALYHNIHREQLQEVASFMARVETDIAQVAAKISDLHMRNNYKMFGNLCGQECQMLTFHHDAEQSQVFPILHEQGSNGLKKVVERLIAEHAVVHELIEELEAAANVALKLPNAETFSNLKEIFEVLNKVVRSHFGYEETELEEALGVIDVGI
jgi:iron-sulfur cluster repair protein YtfE (RIC family)